MEITHNILSVVYVAIGIFAVFGLLSVFFWATGVVIDIEARGSAVALAEKVVSAPCINFQDAKKENEKFLFDKNVLDDYDGKEIPCLDLEGSYYFVEIEKGDKKWHFSNTDINPYAYNKVARGLTKSCNPNFYYNDLDSFVTAHPDIFNYRNSALKFSGVVVDGEEKHSVTIKAIMDPDSGTDFYKAGYPLCLCDIPCPYDLCICSEKCPKSEETVDFGETCN